MKPLAYSVTISVVLVASASVAAGQPASGGRQPPSTVAARALLDRYCVTCHNERTRTGGLTLDHADPTDVGADAAVWERVVRKLRAGEMPPVGRARPPREESEAFASWLESRLDGAAAAKPNPGRPAVHRLNRVEYANAIRDLLGVEIDAPSFLPADVSGYGFDNIADVLATSPGLLDRYMSAARRISRLAVGTTGGAPGFESYRASARAWQSDRTSEDLPFGSRGGMSVRHHFPVDGEYVVKVSLQRDRIELIRGLSQPTAIDVRLDGTLVKTFEMGGVARGRQGTREQREYDRTADSALQIPLAVTAGRHAVAVAFRKKPSWVSERILPPQLPIASFSFLDSREGEPAVEAIQIGGPYRATVSPAGLRRSKIFLCVPASEDEEACARTILGTLARSAYRRPVAHEDVETLLESYRYARHDRNFSGAIELAVQRVLIDPEFLFRVERDPAGSVPGAVHPVSELELASRLSFFLWSSIPDEELLGLAVKGSLRNADVLDRQIRRMLADDRSDALVRNFAGQWLHLRNLRTVEPDPRLFPDFDDNLREAFLQETELFLKSTIREDRSVTDLISADYTFVNERLARHYEIPNVYGSHFRRVTVGETRGGLLGQGSILTVTSYANRTSPVRRGKWLLENLLGSPPPAPPPNVPELKPRDEGGAALSMRAQMERHRTNAICASCHVRMDPLGFAFENFDAVGRWRTTDGDTRIDASGVLPNGTAFDGMVQLRKALFERRQEFVRTLAEKLLTYSLGRGVDYDDAPAVRTIVRAAAAGDYHWSSLVTAIVNSTPFQMRRSGTP